MARCPSSGALANMIPCVARTFSGDTRRHPTDGKNSDQTKGRHAGGEEDGRDAEDDRGEVHHEAQAHGAQGALTWKGSSCRRAVTSVAALSHLEDDWCRC